MGVPMAAGDVKRSRSRMVAIGVPFLVVAIVIVMVVPLPTPILDLLLAANLSIAVVVLVTAMLVNRPLEFSVFPALLLVTTLFRLALNVSTTRLILGQGYGGKVVEAFGAFVVGGSLVVGLVIFLILVVIQFAVVTNGAGRVAEVAARFTLDAMPGKQMAIDADLNAGLITDTEARRRRLEVAREADFYGAMDGASKFVKGDAIAGIVIVAVNLLGGVGVGVTQYDLSIGEAIQRFALMSVGDGLVSQIPALLISVSAGVIVTRVSDEDEQGLGVAIWRQLLQNRRVLSISAALVGGLALLPGLPHLPFLTLAGLLVLAASRSPKLRPDAAPEAAGEGLDEPAPPESETDQLLGQVLVEPLELELAQDLLDLVDPGWGGNLLQRVRALRRQIAKELGLVIPLVRTKDDVSLPAGTYVIMVNGVEVGRGEAPPGNVLVLADGAPLSVPGRPTTEPVYGMPAWWAPAEFGPHLEAQGATVIDRGSVIVTHLASIVRRHAAELLTRQGVRTLLDTVEEKAPTVVGEIGPDGVPVADVQNVLRALLREGVPIRDLVTILETITTLRRESRNADDVLAGVRSALAGAITRQASDEAGVLHIVTLEPMLEHQLLEACQPSPAGPFLAMAPDRTERLIEALELTITEAEQRGTTPAVVTSAALRPILRRMLELAKPDVRVLAYPEIAKTATIDTVGVITLEEDPATIHRLNH